MCHAIKTDNETRTWFCSVIGSLEPCAVARAISDVAYPHHVLWWCQRQRSTVATVTVTKQRRSFISSISYLVSTTVTRRKCPCGKMSDCCIKNKLSVHVLIAKQDIPTPLISLWGSRIVIRSRVHLHLLNVAKPRFYLVNSQFTKYQNL